MFQAGDKVRCIDDTFAPALAPLKIYTIKHTTGACVYFEELGGGYFFERFEKLPPSTPADHLQALIDENKHLREANKNLEADGKRKDDLLKEFRSTLATLLGKL